MVQLVGRNPDHIAAGARLAGAASAETIDLELRLPGLGAGDLGYQCGSALMREPELAERLIASAIGAVTVPVTVKMRLGWDEASKNAPEIAARAEALGVAAVTVHGRTRCQFYKGRPIEPAIRNPVKEAVSIPVIANGDIVDGRSARAALEASGADGVMVGRGVYGRPWIAAQLEAELDGRPFEEPDAEARLTIALAHFRDALDFYGARIGLKVFRKHLAAYIEQAPWPASPEARRAARGELCRLEDPLAVERGLIALWSESDRRLAA